MLFQFTHITDEEGNILNRYEYDAFGNFTLKEETIEKTKIDKEKLEDRMKELLAAVENFDMDGTETLMEELEQYEFDEKFEDLCKELKKVVEDFAYDEAAELIKSFLQISE